MTDIDEDVLQDLYTWVDQIKLSRPKKNIVRDFSDGVLMAEVVSTYFPRYVDLHNFPICHSSSQKKKNWQLLNWKVFKKLNFELSNDVIESIINCKPGTIERVLLLLRSKMDQKILSSRGNGKDERPEADQGTYMVPTQSPIKKETGKVSYRPVAPEMKKTNSMQNIGFKGSEPLTVPRLGFEEKVQECLAKDETIEILQAKIRRLEHLLHLKDVRLDELQARIDELRPTNIAALESSQPQRKALLPRIQ